jgi:hypothetical protein
MGSGPLEGAWTSSGGPGPLRGRAGLLRVSSGILVGLGLFRGGLGPLRGPQQARALKVF